MYKSNGHVFSWNIFTKAKESSWIRFCMQIFWKIYGWNNTAETWGVVVFRGCKYYNTVKLELNVSWVVLVGGTSTFDPKVVDSDNGRNTGVNTCLKALKRQRKPSWGNPRLRQLLRGSRLRGWYRCKTGLLHLNMSKGIHTTSYKWETNNAANHLERAVGLKVSGDSVPTRETSCVFFQLLYSQVNHLHTVLPNEQKNSL